MIHKKTIGPFVICILILLFYGFKLWGISIPLTGDQKVYLSVALEMLEKKSWIIPYLGGEPNFLKPPFQYWATLVGWKLFGMSVFGTLFPSVLALLGSSFLVFKISEKNKVTHPWFASLLFASGLGSMTYGSTAQMEIWIVFFWLASWYFILKENLLAAFLWTGGMALVKGPLYPVLWTFSLLIWNRKWIKKPSFWRNLSVGTLLGLSWYFLAARTHFDSMFHQFFYTENFGKLKTAQGSILGLWVEFFFSLIPWGFLLVIALFQKTTRKKWALRKHFYISYALLPAAFFTFFPYRVGTYLYFLTPIFAMMVGDMEFKFLPYKKILVGVLYLAVFIPILFVTSRLSESQWLNSYIFWILFIGILSLIASIWFEKPFIHALSCLLIVTLIRVSAIEIGELDVRDLKKYVSEHPGQIGYYIDHQDIWHEYGLISTVISQPVTRLYHRESLNQFLSSGGSAIIESDEDQSIGSAYSCTKWQRLKRRTKFPFQRIMKEKVEWGDEEISRNFLICTR